MTKGSKLGSQRQSECRTKYDQYDQIYQIRRCHKYELTILIHNYVRSSFTNTYHSKNTPFMCTDAAYHRPNSLVALKMCLFSPVKSSHKSLLTNVLHSEASPCILVSVHSSTSGESAQIPSKDGILLQMYVATMSLKSDHM